MDVMAQQKAEGARQTKDVDRAAIEGWVSMRGEKGPRSKVAATVAA